MTTDAEIATQVEYRPIAGYPGYRVGDDGSVWSCRHRSGRPGLGKTWRRLSPVVRKNCYGYEFVSLSRDDGQKTIKIHRLVLEAFESPKPKDAICRHLDGNPLNNRKSNLAWGTHAENAADSIRHGTFVVDVDSFWARLKPQDVIEIRRLAAEGVAFSAIGRRFGIHKSAAHNIARGRRWRHVAPVRDDDEDLPAGRMAGE